VCEHTSKPSSMARTLSSAVLALATPAPPIRPPAPAWWPCELCCVAMSACVAPSGGYADAGAAAWARCGGGTGLAAQGAALDDDGGGWARACAGCDQACRIFVKSLRLDPREQPRERLRSRSTSSGERGGESLATSTRPRFTGAYSGSIATVCESYSCRCVYGRREAEPKRRARVGEGWSSPQLRIAHDRVSFTVATLCERQRTHLATLVVAAVHRRADRAVERLGKRGVVRQRANDCAAMRCRKSATRHAKRTTSGHSGRRHA
jgi:hypothetical protein